MHLRMCCCDPSNVTQRGKRPSNLAVHLTRTYSYDYTIPPKKKIIIVSRFSQRPRYFFV